VSRIPSPSLLIPGIVVLAGLAVSASSLRADVIYTNFGADDAYAAGAGIIVTNDNLAWSSVAIAFTPVANYTLSSIEFIATGLNPDGTDTATLGIFADNGGQPGSTPLESFTVDSLAQFGSLVPVMSVTSALQPLLLANTQYWIGMNTTAGNFIVWNQNTTLANGFSQTDGAGNWFASGTDQGVVKVDGTFAPDVSAPNAAPFLGTLNPVPEPGTWWLIAAGLSAIAYLRRVFSTLHHAEQRTRFTHQK
jgi:hypothetical protein